VSTRREAGFTLVEIVVAMVILGAMMLLLWSGVSFSMRSWDAGDRVGRTAADRRIGEAFLRRELGELFPMRWKDPTRVVVAFEGAHDHLRFVSSRPAGISIGGLALVSLEVTGDARRGERNLFMRRALPDDEAKTFEPLDAAEPTVLIAGVDTIELNYFGSENDFVEPSWRDEWKPVERVPQLVRMHLKMVDGSVLPEMTMRVMMTEEAGCLENSFQRFCRPRRAAT
jgi:general secretion pathway protein J